MVDQLNLRELKGAPLSILILLLQSRRSVSASFICRETGYSDKSVTAGLKLLEDRQLITRTGHSGFMLTGDVRQLPLYWDEQITAGSGQPAAGSDPVLEERIRMLELRVRELELSAGSRQQAAGSAIEIGKFPIEVGNFPTPPETDNSNPETEIVKTPIEIVNSPINIGKIPTSPETDNGAAETEIVNSPIEVVNSPINIGKIPTPVNLINNNIPSEVSKKVSKKDKDTYLLDNHNAEGKLTTGTGNIPIPEDAQKAWNAAMVQMKGSMDPGVYVSLLGSAVMVGYEDGHYTIGEINSMAVEWADKRLRKSLEQILKSIAGRECSVSFVVCQDSGDRIQDSGFRYPEPSHELLPMPADEKAGKLTEICNDYLLDPIGIEYSNAELAELVKLGPDPDVLRFALPTMTSFESVKYWCSLDSLTTAKRILLKKYGIVNGMAAAIIHNDAATLEMIRDVCEELCPENRNAVGDRIRKLTSDGIIPF